MENKKDIGKAFREKLEGLDKKAPNGGWNSISAELKQLKKPFSWFKTLVISFLVVIIAAIAAYPLWEDHVPHIYMEMPNGHHENSSPENDADENQVITAPEASGKENNSAAIEYTKGNDAVVNTSPALQPVNNDRTHSAAGTDTPSKSANETTGNIQPHNDASPEREAITIPVNDVSRRTVTDEKAKQPRPDDSEGKVRLLDLSGVSYGADTLKKTKPAKKLDTSRIADSLNRLYGREKKDTKAEKKKS